MDDSTAQIAPPQDSPASRHRGAGARCGALNHMWKGGRIIASNGYVLVRVGKAHHLADVRGYAYEHRVIAEQNIGRRLAPKEQVHHINGDKADNRPENLEVVAGLAEHSVKHRSGKKQLKLPGEDNPVVACMCGCGATFSKYDTSGRPRKYRSGHNARDRNFRYAADRRQQAKKTKEA